MIRITPAAAQRINEAALQSGLADVALRLEVGIKSDGSFTYAMGFDDVGGGEDTHIDCEGIDLVLAPGSGELVEELTIDYVELSPGEHAFIFLNPRDPHFVAPET